MATAPVLVGLDLDHGRLRRPVDPRQREGVRIGLHQLVGGALDHELPELIEGRSPLQVARERWTVVGLDLGEDRRRDLQGIDRPRLAELLDQSSQDRRFELGAKGDQGGIPLELVVDALDPAEVELMDTEERQLEVVVAERVEIVERAGIELARGAAEKGEQFRAQGAARHRQQHRCLTTRRRRPKSPAAR